MKIIKPAEEITVCDLCHYNGYLQTCWACGYEYCLSCQGTVCGSYGFLNVCRECGQRDDVHAICERYAKRLSPIFTERDAKLKKLQKRKATP